MGVEGSEEELPLGTNFRKGESGLKARIRFWLMRSATMRSTKRSAISGGTKVAGFAPIG